MDFGWTLHRLERLSVHVSYLQNINHDSNLRPYLLGLVVSRVHTEMRRMYLCLTKLRNRLSDPLHLPGSYCVYISIEHGHPLSENTLIASSSMTTHYSLLISPTSQRTWAVLTISIFRACLYTTSLRVNCGGLYGLDCQLTIIRR
jgi:hypothetical protein